MQTGASSIVTMNDTWVLKNTNIRCTVSRTTGQIISLVTDKEMLAAPASIVLVDTVDSKTLTYSDGVMNQGSTTSTGNRASLTYSLVYGNSYTATTTLTCTPDAIRWDVELSTTLTPDREMKITYDLPILSSADEAFWAAPGLPVKVADMRAQILEYRTTTYLPWVCIYGQKADHGLSLIAPPDMPKPGLTFHMETANNPKQIRVSNHHLRVGASKPTRSSLFLVPHEGDWRPGLAWLSSSYPEYFQPVSRRVRSGEGWYTVGSPYLDEAVIKDAASRGVTWQELHSHFPFYGVYLPDKPDWANAMDQDDISIDRWERDDAPDRPRNSVDNMRAKMVLWHKYGIQVYIYIQTFEAWKQYALKYFKDDITHDADGKPCYSWQFTNLMNPDPAYPWGKAIQKQLDNIINAYPDVDGIFLDRDDYRDYDFSHSDGLTMQGNRPCYMLAFAQEKALQVLCPKLHKRDKGIWANGPTNLEVCSGIDGIMTEAVGTLANQTQFFGVDRPMICLPYDATVAATEIKLKGCMTGGYFPAVSETSVGSPSRALEAKYVPLFNLMKGRKWVLNAHAIQASDGVSTNLFKATNGDYLAALISDLGTLIVADGSCPVISHDIEVSISVSDPQAIRYCYQLSPDFQGVTELPITRTGKKLKVTVPILISGSLLVFSTEWRYDTTRQSIPLLVKGTSNMLRLKSAIKGAVSVQTPWGAFNSKATSADITTIPVEVPASASGEVLLNLTAHGTTSVLSAWIVNPVELTLPQQPPYIRDVNGADIPIQVTNYTGQPLPITVSGSFSDGKGTINPQRTKLVLKALETKLIQPHVNTSTRQAVITWNLEHGQQSQSFVMPLGSITKFQSSDMFHDDFSSNDMSRWTNTDGVWTVKDGTALGRGPVHAAYIGDTHWSDYEVEVSSCMSGSELPEITWVKSYIHVRMTSQDNYYRFGVHGDARTLELSKLVNGEWTQLVVSPHDMQMGKWITLRVAIKGSEIKCYADGKLVCQATDTSLTKGGVAIGVFDNQMINQYRHVVVRRVD